MEQLPPYNRLTNGQFKMMEKIARYLKLKGKLAQCYHRIYPEMIKLRTFRILFGYGDRIDITPLQLMPALEELEVTHLNQRDLFVLKQMDLLKKNLKKLTIQGGEVNDLSFLKGFYNLETVQISQNELFDLTPLSALKKLKKLNLNENRIIDLAPLSGLKNLEVLDLSENRILDLTPLKKLKKLRVLDIGKNQVRDLTPLIKLKKLEGFHCRENSLEDIVPLFELPRLNHFSTDQTWGFSLKETREYILKQGEQFQPGDEGALMQWILEQKHFYGSVVTFLLLTLYRRKPAAGRVVLLRLIKTTRYVDNRMLFYLSPYIKKDPFLYTTVKGMVMGNYRGYIRLTALHIVALINPRAGEELFHRIELSRGLQLQENEPQNRFYQPFSGMVELPPLYFESGGALTFPEIQYLLYIFSGDQRVSLDHRKQRLVDLITPENNLQFCHWLIGAFHWKTNTPGLITLIVALLKRIPYPDCIEIVDLLYQQGIKWQFEYLLAGDILEGLILLDTPEGWARVDHLIRNSCQRMVKKMGVEAIKRVKPRNLTVDQLIDLKGVPQRPGRIPVEVKAQVLFRLEHLLIVDRRWPVKLWRDIFMKNSVMKRTGTGLIWGMIDGARETLFRYTKKGICYDINGKKVNLTGEIKLCHPVEMGEMEVIEWQNVLKQHDIKQPFPQLSRACYTTTSIETMLTDFSGRVVDKGGFRKGLVAHNWALGELVGAGKERCYYIREIGEIVVKLFLPAGGWHGGKTFTPVAIGDLIFYRGGEAMPLNQIPPRIYSEIYLHLTSLSSVTEPAEVLTV